MLKRFIKVQKKIEAFNAYGTFQEMKVHEEKLETTSLLRRQAERDFKVLSDQKKKQKQDLDNIKTKAFRAYFLCDADHEVIIEQEKKEYDRTKELVKVAERELDETTDKFKTISQMSKDFNEKNRRAIELYKEQMMILNSQFDGDDGSDLENELEALCNKLEKEKANLKAAITRWNNSRFLIIYACGQIQCAEKRWSELMKIDANDPQKVLPTTETINNLISCHENIEKAKSVLKKVEFPLCTDEEMTRMINLTDTLYEDMEIQGKQEENMKTIKKFRKSCSKLKLWFDSVIKETLMVPYTDASMKLNTGLHNLRNERIKLLQEKIRETFSKDVNLETLDMLSTEKDDQLVQNLNAEMEKNKEKLGTSLISEPTGLEFDLPPPPSKEQLLGDVEEIKKEYRKQTDNWNKHLEDSRNEADLKLQRMLSSFNVKSTTIKED